MGVCNADTVDVIKECNIQLQEPDVYPKTFFWRNGKSNQKNPKQVKRYYREAQI